MTSINTNPLQISAIFDFFEWGNCYLKIWCDQSEIPNTDWSTYYRCQGDFVVLLVNLDPTIQQKLINDYLVNAYLTDNPNRYAQIHDLDLSLINLLIRVYGKLIRLLRTDTTQSTILFDQVFPSPDLISSIDHPNHYYVNLWKQTPSARPIDLWLMMDPPNKRILASFLSKMVDTFYFETLRITQCPK